MRWHHLTALLLCLLPKTGSAGVMLEAELGPELDTNANRVQSIHVPCPAGQTCVAGVCQPVGCSGASCEGGDSCIEGGEEAVVAGLMRLTASGRFQLRLGRHALSAVLAAGGKLFLSNDARTADEIVQRLNLGWAALLPSSAVLSVEGSFYDAYQRESVRDFRTGGAVARLSLGRPAGGLGVMASGGYRALQYKPLADYSFQGPTAAIDLSSTLTRGAVGEQVDWNLTLGYSVGYRRFSGAAEGIPQPCPGRPEDICNQPSDADREDLNHLFHLEINYLGNADATLSYGLELNQSNSHGETFQRHVLGIKFTAPLFQGIFFTAKGVLQFSQFRDPYLISRVPNQTFVTIEDENRSRLLLQLARDLTPRISLNLRYGFYVNESVTPGTGDAQVRIPPFMRQTLFVGLRVQWDS